jgi:hypothetical protein
MENLTQTKMQNETVYSKLRKAESFLQQIPEDLRSLFDVKINHLEGIDGDYVGMSWKTNGNYVGTKVDNINSVSLKEGHLFRWVDIQTNGASVTLYESGSTHITLF